MKLTATLLALAAVAAPSAPGAAPGSPDAAACSPAAVAAAGAAVRSARVELTEMPLEEDETLVPPAAGRLIERVKDRMRAFVRAEMACAPASPEPAALAKTMAGRGGGHLNMLLYDPNNMPPDRHGKFLTYRVERVPGQPDLLAVVATLGINCGSDSMLMLYRREGARWRELMVRRAEPYVEIRGGWADLRFAVSPKDPKGRWFVATVSVTPWCTSAWQGLPYELARPGSAPDRPSVFFRGKGTIYLGNEQDLLVRAEAQAFELRNDGSSIDPAVHSRRHVRRYRVSGAPVRRIQPVAESVRDFVDEWIVSPWSEAGDWSGPDPELARSHALLHADPYSQLDEFVSIRSCGGGLTQVEMDAEQGAGWFFLVRGGARGPWILERIARTPAPACSGADILGQQPA